MTEQQFNEKLDRIGELYEEGKDILAYSIVPYNSNLYEILRELRDIAAVNLKIARELTKEE